MRTRDIKALNETIASVVNPMDADRAKALQEGYLNSLTEKARQICEETIEEKAAPGMEDWASDPKVKASFKKQYGKRWKEVMYARSWNLAKKEKELGVNEEAELDLAEGVSAKRMRIIRKHNVSGKPIKGEVADFMQRSFKKKFYKDKEKFGGATPAVLGRAALKHSAMKEKGLAEASLKKALMTGDKVARQKASYRQAQLDAMRLAYKNRGYSQYHPDYETPEEPVKGTRSSDQLAASAKANYKFFKPGSFGKKLAQGDKIRNMKQQPAWNRDEKKAKKQRRERVQMALNAIGIHEVWDQLDEISQKLKDRYAMKRGEQLHRSLYSYRTDKPTFTGKKQARIVKGLRRAMGKDVSESVQLDEGKGGRSGFTNLMKRLVSRVRRAGGREDVQREIGNYTEREAAGGESKMSHQARRAISGSNIEAIIKERDAKKAKARAAMKEQVLAEAGYKKLMRLKGKAYDTRNPKLVRAAAEQEAKVAANMARRGGASAEAVKAGGSRIGKSGKYTQKAGQLANQRDRAFRKFRGRAAGAEVFNAPGPEKRKRQQAQAEFNNRARSGDFGQNNQEGMRPRYNYLKRTGKLKTK
jgi:hypothetical protein